MILPHYTRLMKPTRPERCGCNVSLKLQQLAIKLLDSKRVAHFSIAHHIFDTLKICASSNFKPRLDVCAFFFSSSFNPYLDGTNQNSTTIGIYEISLAKYYSMGYLWVFSSWHKCFVCTFSSFSNARPAQQSINYERSIPAFGLSLRVSSSLLLYDFLNMRLFFLLQLAFLLLLISILLEHFSYVSISYDEMHNTTHRLSLCIQQ